MCRGGCWAGYIEFDRMSWSEGFCVCNLVQGLLMQLWGWGQFRDSLCQALMPKRSLEECVGGGRCREMLPLEIHGGEGSQAGELLRSG